jgi:hypothetical protein
MTVTAETQTFRHCENGWIWMPVEYILQNTDESCDYPEFDYTEFDWEKILREKSSHTGFMHLVNSIMEHGWLSAIGWNEGRITEGHHRLCAAILLGEDEVPTMPYGNQWWEGHISAHRNSDDPWPFDWED